MPLLFFTLTDVKSMVNKYDYNAVDAVFLFLITFTDRGDRMPKNVNACIDSCNVLGRNDLFDVQTLQRDRSDRVKLQFEGIEYKNRKRSPREYYGVCEQDLLTTTVQMLLYDVNVKREFGLIK